MTVAVTLPTPKASPVSSPALTRSPLLTHNATPGTEFGARGSPYAPRAQIGGEHAASLNERLVVDMK